MKLPNYLYHALALLWLYSGIISLCFKDIGIDLLSQMGFIYPFALWLLYGASWLDMLFGALIMTKLRQKPVLWLIQLMTVVIYTLLILVLLPKALLIEQLIHPFAPIIKNLPITAMLLYVYQHHQTT
ncbi:MAG: DoxX-like family protein [Moraxella sp.]|nr:DoxX-like family protein [Moraxella sp.]